MFLANERADARTSVCLTFASDKFISKPIGTAEPPVILELRLKGRFIVALNQSVQLIHSTNPGDSKH